MDFLKNILGGVAALTVGLMIATYFGDAQNPSVINSLVNAWSSLKTSFTNALNPQNSGDSVSGRAQEGTPLLSDSQKKEAEKYFEAAATSDPSQSPKEKEDKKESHDKSSKAKEDVPVLNVPVFLVPVKKDSSHDSIPHGAVYNGGTSPYGPPPSVKNKIFREDTILTIPDDPNTANEVSRNHQHPYRKNEKSLLEGSHVDSSLAISHPFEIEGRSVKGQRI